METGFYLSNDALSSSSSIPAISQRLMALSSFFCNAACRSKMSPVTSPDAIRLSTSAISFSTAPIFSSASFTFRSAFLISLSLSRCSVYDSRCFSLAGCCADTGFVTSVLTSFLGCVFSSSASDASFFFSRNS